MNPVLIVVIIVLVLLGIKGAFKGLFKILFSIVTLIACILIAGFITVPVANGLKANTGMYGGIDGFVYDTVKDNKNLNNKIDSSFAPVSYTHLDVYKRQDIMLRMINYL